MPKLLLFTMVKTLTFSALWTRTRCTSDITI
jgi:hypothetical protein